MATSMKKTTTETKKSTTTVKAEANTDVVKVEPTKNVEPEKRKFEKTDMIPCKSITCGELLMEGQQTHLLYKWADVNDVQEVEYQDLLYDVRTGNSFSKFPRFIVMDEDFVEQNSVLKDVYSKMYTNSDLLDILNLPVDDLRRIVTELPKGVKSSIKTLAATMINNGSFDSINKIKALDEIFETNMLQLLLDN